MESRRKLANAVGLGGCLAIVWGVHGLVPIGPCGGDTGPECPPEATPYFVAVSVGLPAAIVAAIAGGRLVFLTMFPAAAVGVLWGATQLPAGERSGAYLIAGVFLAGTLLPLVAMRLTAAKRHTRAQWLISHGEPAIGTVTAATDVGVTINKVPRVKLSLLVEPENGGEPFDAEKIITVTRIDVAQPGRRYPVWFDPADRTSFALATKEGDDSPEEVRRLFAKVAATEQAAPPEAGGSEPDEGDPLDRLAKLYELYEAGALTQQEYESQKARLL